MLIPLLSPWLAFGLPLATLQGPGAPIVAEPTRYGATVDSAGDLDLDGSSDILVGAWWHHPDAGSHGSVSAWSGRSGKVLFEVFGETEGGLFGLALGGAGDTNSDGAADFVVGAPFAADKRGVRGRVRLFSGRGGSVLHDLLGEEEGERFGWAARGAGDVNQDGFDDFVVGAPMGKAKRGDERPGVVRVYSGKNAKLLHTWYGAADGDVFGHTVDGAGDVDGDGSDDLLVGAFGGGYVRVYSGRKGEVLHTFEPARPNSGFGWIARSAGDTIQDGVSDLIVGVPWGEPLAARVYSGKKGEPLLSFDRSEAPDDEGWSFGMAVDGAGDVNGDGFADLIVGDPGFPGVLAELDGRPLSPFQQRVRAKLARAGRARVFSGHDGELLHEFEGSAPDDWFGVSVAAAGDVNQDGSGDVVIGAGRDADYQARVFSGLDGKLLLTLSLGE